MKQETRHAHFDVPRSLISPEELNFCQPIKSPPSPWPPAIAASYPTSDYRKLEQRATRSAYTCFVTARVNCTPIDVIFGERRAPAGFRVACAPLLSFGNGKTPFENETSFMRWLERPSCGRWALAQSEKFPSTSAATASAFTPPPPFPSSPAVELLVCRITERLW
jgi:hypothetical protein